MDIEQIDLGEHLARTCTQGSDTLVVSFEIGGGDVNRSDENNVAWAQDVVANAGWDGLYILPKTMNWYQSPELWEFFRTMQKTGFFTGYKRVVMYGNSMGGFAALAFAKLSNAKRVVVFHPRTLLKHSELPWASKFSQKLKYNRTGPRADALNGLEAETDVMIFVDPLFKRDKAHANWICGGHKRTEIIRVPFIGHDIPTFLSSIGIISTVARSAIDGKFDHKWFYSAIRARRSNPDYLLRLRKASSGRSCQLNCLPVHQDNRDFGADPKEE